MATVNVLSTGIRPADIPERQLTTRLGANLNAGQVVRLDATNGTFVAAADAANQGTVYVLLNGGVSGEYRTGVARGKIEGYNVSSLNFGAQVFAGASGTLDNAGGTNNVFVGRVIPATANGGPPFDKIVEVG